MAGSLAADGLPRSFISGLPWRGDAAFKDAPPQGELFCEKLRQALESHPVGSAAFNQVDISKVAMLPACVDYLFRILREKCVRVERLKAFDCGLDDSASRTMAEWINSMPESKWMQLTSRRPPVWLRVEGNGVDDSAICGLVTTGRAVLAASLRAPERQNGTVPLSFPSFHGKSLQMNVQLKPFQRQSEMGTGRPLSTSHPSHPPLAPAQCPGQSGNFHSHFSDFPSNGSHTFQTSQMGQIQSPSSGSNTTMGMNADSISTHVFPPLPPMLAENSERSGGSSRYQPAQHQFQNTQTQGQLNYPHQMKNFETFNPSCPSCPSGASGPAPVGQGFSQREFSNLTAHASGCNSCGMSQGCGCTGCSAGSGCGYGSWVQASGQLGQGQAFPPVPPNPSVMQTDQPAHLMQQQPMSNMQMQGSHMCGMPCGTAQGTTSQISFIPGAQGNADMQQTQQMHSQMHIGQMQNFQQMPGTLPTFQHFQGQGPQTPMNQNWLGPTGHAAVPFGRSERSRSPRARADFRSTSHSGGELV